ncbi:hypothetical protein MPLDJ20_20216 [Mesorhizobium plurifarium]|uniref:Amine oxidase domain-containing protein n=1 Tax=Mesorhizobium plurifarium TaxID=69974 RepID=A0A090F1V7_MESPL|nr:hypothetical protein MPLSOD_150113 [Mesorhizobium sp. SOD10]CDX35486.1 hypothetical protein MPLDJ20_20216 [Mesorhizobium plurifarium]
MLSRSRNQPDLDVAIIGAGPAGLRTAYHLRESGLRVKVFEALPHVGGRTRTDHVAGEDINIGGHVRLCWY